MYFKVLIFVTGINQILGRPIAESNIESNGNSIPIPPWPLEGNVFLLPTVLNSNDMINITMNTKDAPKEVSINFMGDDEQSTSIVFFSIKADFMNSIVTIFNEMAEPVVEEQIEHFFLDDEKMLFNMWLKRRDNEITEENNVLEVNTKSFALKPFIVNNINKIRYLKFNGDSAKMIKLEFQFA